MNKLLSLGAPLAVALLAVSPARGADGPEELIRQAAANQQVGNTIQKIELTLTSADGQVKTRTLKTYTRITDGHAESHAVLLAPEELKGFQFLSQERDGEDAKWLYMPLGDNLNRIQGSRRTQSFMGTDFTYEDMELGDVEGGTHELLGTETIEVGGASIPCYKIATVPDGTVETAYGRLVTWLQKDPVIPRRIVFFDKDGQTRRKRLEFLEIAREGETILPTKMRMENLQRGSATLLEVEQYDLHVAAEDLPGELFDPQTMSQVR